MLAFSVLWCANVCRQNIEKKKRSPQTRPHRETSLGHFHHSGPRPWQGRRKRALKTTLSVCSDAKITLRLWQSKDAPATDQGRVEFLLSFIMFDVCLKAFKALIEGCQMCSGIFMFLENSNMFLEALKGEMHNPQNWGRKHTLQLDTVRKLDWAVATSPVCPSIWPQAH